MLQVGTQKYQRMLKILLSCLACSQIWLNLPVDDHHFGYITSRWTLHMETYKDIMAEFLQKQRWSIIWQV